MANFEGKRALVTGANRGIGQGIAEEFAANGANVGVNHLPSEQDAAEDVVAGIEAAGGTATTFPADVTDENQVDQLFGRIDEEFGGLDVLVNNAGISTNSPLEDMPVSMWDEMFAVHLRGAFLMSRQAIPRLRDAGQGSIINMASVFAIEGAANSVHYCAAKGGLISFTRALAREVAPDIRVNAIAPGPIDTEMMRSLYTTEDARRERAQELPLDRLGQVEDIAKTAAFLASEDSSFFTGQTLGPNGGAVMH